MHLLVGDGCLNLSFILVSSGFADRREENVWKRQEEQRRDTYLYPCVIFQPSYGHTVRPHHNSTHSGNRAPCNHHRGPLTPVVDTYRSGAPCSMVSVLPKSSAMTDGFQQWIKGDLQIRALIKPSSSKRVSKRSPRQR